MGETRGKIMPERVLEDAKTLSEIEADTVQNLISPL
jgi:hypothetical protein